MFTERSKPGIRKKAPIKEMGMPSPTQNARRRSKNSVSTKNTKIKRSTTTGKFVTRPIGKGKAEKFTAVEGMHKSAASKALSGSLTVRGLKGDAYRTEVTKAFKKA